MESRLYSPLTTAAIARRLEISVRTLELLFRQALDIGPGTYYLRLRLQAARRLLLDTQLSMQAVAVRCGFGSHSAFSRIFRQHFGARPRRPEERRVGKECVRTCKSRRVPSH